MLGDDEYSESIINLAKVLVQEQFEETRLQDVGESIEAAGASKIVDYAMDLLDDVYGDPEEAVIFLMTRLEKLSELDRGSAVIMMAHLWPFADDLNLDDICDSISLWVNESEVPEAFEALEENMELE